MTSKPKLILAQPTPGIKTTTPSIAYQGAGDKWATDEQRSRGLRPRKNDTFITWNVRTLRSENQENLWNLVAHHMNRYEWNVTGLSEVRWKRYGDKTTDERHKFHYGGRKTNMNIVSDFSCTKIPSIQ